MLNINVANRPYISYSRSFYSRRYKNTDPNTDNT